MACTGGPCIELPTGQKMPMLGLGTRTKKSKPGQVKNAVMAAIDAGYRHIDGAFAYQNEHEVGDAIRTKINDGTITREDIFYTSKLWNIHHHPDDVEKACRSALDVMQLEYFDLYQLHWPFAFKSGDVFWPVGDDGKLIFEDIDYVDTWKAMETLVSKGLCKAIGLANFPIDFMKRILSINRVPVSNLQVEAHPYLPQHELVDFCKKKGIIVTAYSPLGSPDRPGRTKDDPVLMEDPVVKAIAESKGKSPAQILIRFNLQRGHRACTLARHLKGV
ncbi:aldo-keto reductase family 1 member A1-like [Amphiura filiformis]|uniref:aldo-keto reductase family 1 member A1-like n=1 Tax=Amphiura filiformis TaxID=82378 RepID=UPI003B2233E9